jgi:glucokinase
MTAQPLLIVADIGGTNTRVALADGRAVRAQSVRKYANAEFPGIEPVLRRYMAEIGVDDVDGTCVAAAGPVRNGVATMTNLAWVIDGAALAKATRAEQVAVLNDLQAQGHALGSIAPQHLRVLIPGKEEAHAAKLVVGLGTGMNAAPVHETPWGRVVAASECGHITMPVRTAEDFALAQFIEGHGAQAHGFAGVEEVLAGRGLARLYGFVTARAGAEVEKTPAEVMAALTEGDAAATEAARLYVHVLGQELGNLALVHLPFGGIYLIGGVARAMTPWMERFGLAAAFRDKGRFSDFMGNFAVSVIEDDYAALTGCASYLMAGGKG